MSAPLPPPPQSRGGGWRLLLSKVLLMNPIGVVVRAATDPQPTQNLRPYSMPRSGFIFITIRIVFFFSRALLTVASRYQNQAFRCFHSSNILSVGSMSTKRECIHQPWWPWTFIFQSSFPCKLFNFFGHELVNVLLQVSRASCQFRNLDVHKPKIYIRKSFFKTTQMI